MKKTKYLIASLAISLTVSIAAAQAVTLKVVVTGTPNAKGMVSTTIKTDNHSLLQEMRCCQFTPVKRR
ncbi:hypothetical protein [Kiloniella sp. EL199]|uniref:hypothetical protein n=1 Tax=Kiloniella sp. EL199 TaxID=2107581 RepID=UPI000EA31C45|nr:hypothetical protein [Kiloniella sp. EL199]